MVCSRRRSFTFRFVLWIIQVVLGRRFQFDFGARGTISLRAKTRLELLYIPDGLGRIPWSTVGRGTTKGRDEGGGWATEVQGDAGRALCSINVDAAAASARVVGAGVHGCGRLRLVTLVWM